VVLNSNLGTRIVDMLRKFAEWQLIVLLISVITAPLFLVITNHFLQKRKMPYKKAQFYSGWMMILLTIGALIIVTVVYS
jgi:uncharacterized membrane protein